MSVFAESLASNDGRTTVVELVPWAGPLQDEAGERHRAMAEEMAADARITALTITDNGLRDMLSIMAKSWLSVQAALLLAYTTPFTDLVGALRALRIPAIIVSIISFMYRYLAVLTDEAGRMSRARQSRSAEAPQGRSGGSFGWRAKVTGSMVGSLFIRSYERSERIYSAMLARGFAGTVQRVQRPRPDQRSMMWFTLALAAIVVFVVAVNLWSLR